MIASTTQGSNCVPAQRRSSATASSIESARFAVSSGALATLEVDLLYKASKGKIRTIGGISAIAGLAHTSWAPALPIVLALDTLVSDLLVLDLNTTEVAFRFRASIGLLTSATWKIDDLYVDPWADKLGW